jgi:hypothetical protein
MFALRIRGFGSRKERNNKQIKGRSKKREGRNKSKFNTY